MRTASAVLAADTTSAPLQSLAQEAGALAACLGWETTRSICSRGKRRRAIRQWRDRVHDLADDPDLVGLEHQRVERRVDRSFERVLDRHQRALRASRPATAITQS